MARASSFFTGSPGKVEAVSTLLPEQQGLYKQLIGAGKGAGAGGAFGTAADYYRNLLSDNPADLAAFTAPAMRQYSEDIVPGLSEQFAGMGAGGLSSSGFRNAQMQGATDLAERLGAIRANLRQAGAQGLQGIGQAGLGNYSQMMQTEAPTQGALPGIMAGIGTAVGGPLGAAAGNVAGNWISNRMNQQESPVQQNASPTPLTRQGGMGLW